jgi:hypothetical protein
MSVIYLHAGGDLKEAYGVLRQLLDAERLLNVRFKIEPLGYKILAVVVPDDNTAVALRLKFGGILNEIDEPGTNAHRACTECRWRSPSLVGKEFATCKRPLRERNQTYFCDIDREFSNLDNCGPNGFYFQPRIGMSQKIGELYARVISFFSY